MTDQLFPHRQRKRKLVSWISSSHINLHASSRAVFPWSPLQTVSKQLAGGGKLIQTCRNMFVQNQTQITP